MVTQSNPEALQGARSTNRPRERERSTRMLLAIAVFKFVKAGLLVALGFAAFSLAHDDRVLVALRRLITTLGFGTHGELVDRTFGKVLGIDHRRLRELGVGTFVYAAVFLVEGTGLLLRKRWAEYVTTIITASFIPLEIYEMVHKPSAFKAIGIVVNVAIVAYLLTLLRSRKAHGGQQ